MATQNCSKSPHVQAADRPSNAACWPSKICCLYTFEEGFYLSQWDAVQGRGTNSLLSVLRLTFFDWNLSIVQFLNGFLSFSLNQDHRGMRTLCFVMLMRGPTSVQRCSMMFHLKILPSKQLETCRSGCSSCMFVSSFDVILAKCTSLCHIISTTLPLKRFLTYFTLQFYISLSIYIADHFGR